MGAPGPNSRGRAGRAHRVHAAGDRGEIDLVCNEELGSCCSVSRILGRRTELMQQVPEPRSALVSPNHLAGCARQGTLLRRFAARQ